MCECASSRQPASQGTTEKVGDNVPAGFVTYEQLRIIGPDASPGLREKEFLIRALLTGTDCSLCNGAGTAKAFVNRIMDGLEYYHHRSLIEISERLRAGCDVVLVRR